MDDNKLDMLRKVGYTIRKCCGMCYHGKFQHGTDWGTCGTHSYEHKKHTGGAKSSYRELSINRFGTCDDFDMKDQLVYELFHFKEFVE